MRPWVLQVQFCPWESLFPRVWKGSSPVGEGSSPSAVEVNLLVSLLLRELTRSHPWA